LPACRADQGAADATIRQAIDQAQHLNRATEQVTARLDVQNVWFRIHAGVSLVKPPQSRNNRTTVDGRNVNKNNEWSPQSPLPNRLHRAPHRMMAILR
jgi:hypothetical protein